MSSTDLDRLLRWETAGATWELVSVHDGVATVRMCRCDGGEEVEQMRSSEAALIDYVTRE